MLHWVLAARKGKESKSSRLICCSVVAVRCSVLQCVHCVAGYCSVLQCVAVCCSTFLLCRKESRCDFESPLSKN